MDKAKQSPPRVAVVGGLTRAVRAWERAGAAIGVSVEHHDGVTAGGRAATLAAMVRRADIVVSITMPNSHGAVAIARREAASHGCVFVLVNRLRPHALPAIVAAALRSGPLPSGMARSAKPASRVRIPEGTAMRRCERRR